ncbi:response regulator [Pontibacter sp. CAU 1760]
MHELGKVLLVDDDAAHTFLSARALCQANAIKQVFKAEDGSRALELLLSEAMDLILLDVNMPVMNGYEFLEALKKLVETTGLTPPTVVLMTTSEKYEGSEHVTQNPMIKGLLTKPLTNDQINYLVSFAGVERQA